MEGENSQQGCEFASWAWTVFMPASSDHLLVLFLIFAPLHGNPCHLDFLLVSSSRPRELCDVEYFPIWTYHRICYRVIDDRFTCRERRRNRELSVKRMEKDSVASVQRFDIAPLGRYLCPVEFWTDAMVSTNHPINRSNHTVRILHSPRDTVSSRYSLFSHPAKSMCRRIWLEAHRALLLARQQGSRCQIDINLTRNQLQNDFINLETDRPSKSPINEPRLTNPRRTISHNRWRHPSNISYHRITWKRYARKLYKRIKRLFFFFYSQLFLLE